MLLQFRIYLFKVTSDDDYTAKNFFRTFHVDLFFILKNKRTRCNKNHCDILCYSVENKNFEFWPENRVTKWKSSSIKYEDLIYILRRFDNLKRLHISLSQLRIIIFRYSVTSLYWKNKLLSQHLLDWICYPGPSRLSESIPPPGVIFWS